MIDRVRELFGDEEPVLDEPVAVTADILPFGFAEPGAELPQPAINPFEIAMSDAIPTGLRVKEKGGLPCIQKVPRFNKEQMEDLLMVMLGEPLALTSDQMKNASVVQRIFHRLGLQAIGGDFESQKEIMNRILGKPQQTSKNLNVTASYSDYLNSLEDDDGPEASEDSQPPSE